MLYLLVFFVFGYTSLKNTREVRDTSKESPDCTTFITKSPILYQSMFINSKNKLEAFSRCPHNPGDIPFSRFIGKGHKV